MSKGIPTVFERDAEELEELQSKCRRQADRIEALERAFLKVIKSMESDVIVQNMDDAWARDVMERLVAGR